MINYELVTDDYDYEQNMNNDLAVMFTTVSPINNTTLGTVHTEECNNSYPSLPLQAQAQNVIKMCNCILHRPRMLRGVV